MEVSGLIHAPAALLLGKEPRYLLTTRQGEAMSRSGHFGELVVGYSRMYIW